MTDLVLGENECPFTRVCNVFLAKYAQAVTLSPLFSLMWVDLARQLNIDSLTEEVLRQGLVTGTKTIAEVFSEILVRWKYYSGKEANMATLLAKLEKIGWINVSYALREEFNLLD